MTDAVEALLEAARDFEAIERAYTPDSPAASFARPAAQRCREAAAALGTRTIDPRDLSRGRGARPRTGAGPKPRTIDPRDLSRGRGARPRTGAGPKPGTGDPYGELRHACVVAILWLTRISAGCDFDEDDGRQAENDTTRLTRAIVKFESSHK